MSRGNNHQNGSVDADVFDMMGSVRVFIEALRLHKFLVLFICLITIGVAALYQRLWPPVYKVQAQLASERSLDSSRDPFYASWQIFRKEDGRDEVKLFTAGPVLRDVIEKNHLKYDDVYHPFLSHAGYLWQKSWLGKEYASLKAKYLGVPEATDEQIESGLTLEGLKAGIDIAEEGDSNVASLTVSGPTPRVSEIANSLIDSYLTYRKSRHADEAHSAFSVLSQEAGRASSELEEVKKRREEFSHTNGLLIDLQKETQDVRQLTEVETTIAAHKAKISALEGNLQDIEARLQNETPEKVLSSVKQVNNVREQAKLKRLEMETNLIALRSRYREDSPEVREVLENIAKLDALIAAEPDYIDASVTTGINTLHQQLASNRFVALSDLGGERNALASQEALAAKMRERLEQLPELTATFTDIQRDYDLAKEKYQRLLLKRMEAQISATALESAPASVRVIDYASKPITKFWPRAKYLYPGALLVGLALGGFAALIRSLTAGRLLRTDVERGRLATPVYATIGVSGRPRLVTVRPRPPEPADPTTPSKSRSQAAGQ